MFQKETVARHVRYFLKVFSILLFSGRLELIEELEKYIQYILVKDLWMSFYKKCQ